VDTGTGRSAPFPASIASRIEEVRVLPPPEAGRAIGLPPSD
jgi:hypothetical protein